MVKLFVIHFVVSVFLLIYVTVDWGLNKQFAFENGWDIDKCDPVHPIELWMYFVPVVNVIFSLLNLKFNEMMSETKKEKGTVLSIFVGPFGFHYTETEDAI